jgi:hypothetical protein
MRAIVALAFAIAGTGCALFQGPLQSPARGGAPWREITSEHFVLYTDFPSAEARHELAEFESLRHALEEVAFPPGNTPEPRMAIVLLRQQMDYEALAPLHTGGATAPRLPYDIERHPTMIMNGEAVERVRRVFVHEEVHELMHRAFGTSPTWLNEGLADYFSTLRIEGDTVILGGPIPERVQVPLYQLPSAAEILRSDRAAFTPAPRHPYRAAAYYAGAWLLVHLFRNGPEAYRKRFDDLTDALGDRRSIEDAWRTAMAGVSPEQLEEDFRAHVDATHWPLYGKKIAPASPPSLTERAMSPSEVHLLWARSALRDSPDRAVAVGQIEEAERLAPGSAEVAYVRGCHALVTRQDPVAVAAFSEARERDPEDPRFIFGMVQATRDCGLEGAPKDAALCDALVARARSPEENAMASVYLAGTGQVDAALGRAKRAFRADLRCEFCAGVLADLLSAEGKTDEAIDVLEQATSISAETALDRALADRLAKYRAEAAKR